MIQRPDNPDGLYVLSTAPPFYLGHVWKGDNPESKHIKVSGYQIYLTPAGKLDASADDLDFYELSDLFRHMADFFLSFKIKGQEPKYRRYADTAINRAQ